MGPHPASPMSTRRGREGPLPRRMPWPLDAWRAAPAAGTPPAAMSGAHVSQQAGVGGVQARRGAGGAGPQLAEQRQPQLQPGHRSGCGGDAEVDIEVPVGERGVAGEDRHE